MGAFKEVKRIRRRQEWWCGTELDPAPVNASAPERPRLLRMRIEVSQPDGPDRVIALIGGTSLEETKEGHMIWSLRPEDTDANYVIVLDERTERKVMKWLRKRGWAR